MSEPFAFNPIDEATRRDPFPTYQRARREVPVYAHPGLPVTSVFRYDDVQGILRDPRTWSSAGLRRDLMKAEAEHEMPPPMMLQDGAEHARLRSLVNQAFTPRIVARLEPWIRAIAHELLDAALATCKVDLVAALATPLPVRVIAELIGIPTQDGARFVEWSDALAANVGSGFLGASSPAQQQAQVAITRELHRYFEPLVERRRSEPRDDLLSGLVAAELEGSRLSFPELLQMLMLLLVAGNETTTTLIGNAVLDLLERPELLARGRRDRAFLPAFVEEVLRFSSPIQMDARAASTAVELHGHRFEPGDVVLAWLGAANRDEDHFERAEEFTVDRRDDRHLAFGFGSHFCLGSNLARLETRVALDVLLEHKREIEPDWSGALPLHPSFVFRSYTCVPVRLAAA
ncbi:MAG: cytochrome P450 [Deltaproteobacteria bacterium]|nr:MAG: cytochrome P450 [Deltaproteobacteria bacterium]